MSVNPKHKAVQSIALQNIHYSVAFFQRKNMQQKLSKKNENFLYVVKQEPVSGLLIAAEF